MKKGFFNLLLLCIISYTQLTLQAQEKHTQPTWKAQEKQLEEGVVASRLMPIDPDPTLEPFFHGVASGDPTANAVMIWTRPTPTDPTQSVAIQWQVALDTLFQDIVAFGCDSTDASRDFTFKTDVTGLQPYTHYYYRFFALGKYSLIGRTKTAPDGPVDNLRFAVVSCSNFEHGYFNVYHQIAEHNDVDAVIHLGDYIYEYGNGEFGNERPAEPANEILTLDDYRLRHATYKLDPDLRLLHQNFPFMTTWDDHETANDSWYGGASNHDSGEGDWFDRKSAGIHAYNEWMPLRRPDPTDEERIYRYASYGDLADIFILDTRLEGREEQTSTTLDSEVDNPDRTLLGQEQYDWLTTGLTNSTAKWKVLAQQVMMAPLEAFGASLNPDQWDGYRIERSNLLTHITGIGNVVVLTGDIHTSWANDVPNGGYNGDTGAGSRAVEFVTSSVTSLSFPISIGESLVQLLNPHIKYVDLAQKGFIILDLVEGRAQANWYYVPTVTSIDYSDSFGKAFYTNDGANRLTESPTPSEALNPQPPLAPSLPPAPNVNVRLKAFLEGVYDTLANSMTTTLQTNNLLPLSQPFNRPPWSYPGPESLAAPADIPTDVVDWVLVEVRAAADSSQIIEQRAAFLKSNGEVVDTDGTTGVDFYNLIPNKTYWISLRARNHLATMSSTALVVPNLHDFSTSMSQALGPNQMIEVANGIFAQFAGDYNGDGVITYADFNYYLSQLSQSGIYSDPDGNMDSNVNTDDFDIYKPNVKVIGIDVMRY